MPSLELDVHTTALVLIDLQQAIVARQLAPRPAADVVRTAATLATACRARDVPVVYVRVDMANVQRLPVDQPGYNPNAPPLPPSASEIVPEAGRQPEDLLITKCQWDAFHGTDLERQLRARGVRTILLGGIATNFGVESTARTANALGFAVVLIEDATATSAAPEAHQFALSTIFPRIARVRQSAEVLAALAIS